MMIPEAERDQEFLENEYNRLDRHRPRNNEYQVRRENVLESVRHLRDGRRLLIDAFRNRIFPLRDPAFYPQYHDESNESSSDSDDEYNGNNGGNNRNNVNNVNNGGNNGNNGGNNLSQSSGTKRKTILPTEKRIKNRREEAFKKSADRISSTKQKVKD